jgi:hypothetical protein
MYWIVGVALTLAARFALKALSSGRGASWVRWLVNYAVERLVERLEQANRRTRRGKRRNGKRSRGGLGRARSRGRCRPIPGYPIEREEWDCLPFRYDR